MGKIKTPAKFKKGDKAIITIPFSKGPGLEEGSIVTIKADSTSLFYVTRPRVLLFSTVWAEHMELITGKETELQKLLLWDGYTNEKF